MARRRKREIRIGRADQLRALRTPMRQEIMALLTRSGPRSVGELAREMGIRPASLYYHIHELAAAGLVREAGSRAGRPRSERLYDAAADRVVLQRKSPSPELSKAMDAVRAATLAAAGRELEQAIEAGDAASGPGAPTLLRVTASLDEAALERTDRMIRELVDFMREKNDSSRGRPFALTLTLAPLIGRR